MSAKPPTAPQNVRELLLCSRWPWLGLAFPFLVWLTSRVVEEVTDKEELVEVPVALSAPPPPPPPPGGKKSSVKKEKKPEEIKPQQEVPQEVQPLQPDPPQQEEESTDAGVEGGQEGGVEGGTVGGVVGGTIGGTGTDLNAPAVKSVYYRAVKPKYTPREKMPDPLRDAASSMGMRDEHCQVKVVIDETGHPIEAEARSCPEVFKQYATAQALKYEFEPYLDAGHAIKVSFVWDFHFVIN